MSEAEGPKPLLSEAEGGTNDKRQMTKIKPQN